MKQTWLIMGMPITLVIEDGAANASAFDKIEAYFHSVDDKYSPYKADSEVSKINNGLPESEWSSEMKTILELSQQTKQQTNGYFDVHHDGKLDPSGLVKGWAINQAANILSEMGFKKFFVDAGGDIQANGQLWKVGIRNPFNREEIVKVMNVRDKGVATSGTYIRGQHIYNPHDDAVVETVASLTVVGPNIYEADRFATAAFAMGVSGIGFIEALDGFEGFMITSDKQATLTRGFSEFVEVTS